MGRKWLNFFSGGADHCRRWAWLDEGLAGDLELVPTLDDGRLLSGPLGRRAVHMVGGGRRYGPLIALDRLLLASRRGHLETLPALIALDAEAFRSSSRTADLYALSALWVRFLLDDRIPAGRQRSDLFQQHLQNVVTIPSSPLPPALASHDLDRDFRRWLIDLARRTKDTAHPAHGDAVPRSESNRTSKISEGKKNHAGAMGQPGRQFITLEDLNSVFFTLQQ